jgi:hypothetical protein
MAGRRQLLGAPVAAALEKRLERHVFLFGVLAREIDAIPSGVIREMMRLLELVRRPPHPKNPRRPRRSISPVA